MNTIASQIRLGASIVGIWGAVGKTIAKTSIPPLQKATVIEGSGLIAGLGHSMITTLNKNSINVMWNNTSNVISKT